MLALSYAGDTTITSHHTSAGPGRRVVANEMRWRRRRRVLDTGPLDPGPRLEDARLIWRDEMPPARARGIRRANSCQVRLSPISWPPVRLHFPHHTLHPGPTSHRTYNTTICDSKSKPPLLRGYLPVFDVRYYEYPRLRCSPPTHVLK
jgi:hypothetical protein